MKKDIETFNEALKGVANQYGTDLNGIMEAILKMNHMKSLEYLLQVGTISEADAKWMIQHFNTKINALTVDDIRVALLRRWTN